MILAIESPKNMRVKGVVFSGGQKDSLNSLAFISPSFDQLYSQFVGVLYEVENTCAMAKKSSG
ncbi:unnamed protein product [Brassica napus]|uniref:(rape) hypothetical protein n=1 Tax=Brassica napus TaxID=3708 RepID=A0A816TWH5_BRANA|nr:unnamed protein product [Brassica napus]